MHRTEVLRRPVLTEKTDLLGAEHNQYVFEVDKRSTKALVKEAVETLFNVEVERVNIINVPPKRSRRARSRRLLVRRSGYKKAIVTLGAGESIDIFEGVK